jgi:glycosyltransferase involved in cell wall biosynthesis
MTEPLVSVVMPTYHSEKHLDRAIASIINQTYQNYEFIIVADEPSAEERDIIYSFYSRYSHIIFIVNKERIGLVASLNKGFALARGKYIARMDADDISYPTRLEKQVAYMESHHEVGVCGACVIHEWNGISEKTIYPTNNASIIAMMMMLGCSIVHPAAIIRTDFIRTIPGPYAGKFQYAEDYYLWTRCIGKTIFHNLEDVLLVYRSDGSNICAVNKSKQADELEQLKTMAAEAVGLPAQKDKSLDKWLHELVIENNHSHRLPVDSFNRILAERWYNECLLLASSRGLGAWELFWASRLSHYIPMPFYRQMKFLVACLMRMKL